MDIILGIETSCDETAAAVVADGTTILSSVVASQIEIHHPYGGVVPELASRHHLASISLVVEQALSEAGITLEEVGGIAVTRGPGLVGALLVGFSFAKMLAHARGVPFVGVDHLSGHLLSVFLTETPPDFPFVSLLVSGGHTCLYHVKGFHDAVLLGQTRDDAAGEAYDKVSKMLGLGYPGGAVIDRMAHAGDPGKISLPIPMLDKNAFDFSFSGLKSAVARYLQESPPQDESDISDIAASFQHSVTEVLTRKLMTAARQMECRCVSVVGGVAANRGLREKMAGAAKENGISLHIPPLSLCGDNAAMIAASGYHLLKAGKTGHPEDDVYSRIPRPRHLPKNRKMR